MMQSFENLIRDNFTSEGVLKARIVAVAIIAILTFTLFFIVGKGKEFVDKVRKIKDSSITGMEEYMKSNKKVSKLNFEGVDKMLTSKGMKFKFKHMGPMEYLAINVILAIVCAMFGYLMHPLAAIPGLFIGWNLFDLYIIYSNNSDNQDMMEDIRIAIVTLKMQTRAGLYITNTLAETLTVVKNKRLKEAIIQLSGDIYNSETIDKAVDIFNSKFENMYIDALAVIIKQNTESGKASQSLKDIETSLDTLQAAIIERQKKSMDTQVTIIKLMIYFGVIATIFYGLILSMLDSDIMSL